MENKMSKDINISCEYLIADKVYYNESDVGNETGDVFEIVSGYRDDVMKTVITLNVRDDSTC